MSSIGISGICCISTISLFALPVNILVSIKFVINIFIASLVPSLNLVAFKFHNKKIFQSYIVSTYTSII